MKKEQAKKHLKEIIALSEGKQIQYLNVHMNNWETTDNPEFATDTEYRIKPEPTYRAYTPQETRSLVGAILIQNTTGDHMLVTKWSPVVGHVFIHDRWYSGEELLQQFKNHDDGMSCGYRMEIVNYFEVKGYE